MMDITSLFKASVKTVRTRNKALGLNSKPEDPNRIFPRTSKDLSKFQTKAKEIVSNVAKLKEFLTENRKAYLDTSVQLFNQVPKLSQADRAEFDSTTQLIIKTSSQYLQELRRENANLPANAQTKEHRTIVINIIEQYFKSVCKTYQELKELYTKRQQELNKVTKLEGDGMGNFRKVSVGFESSTESPRIYSSYDEDDNKGNEEKVSFTVAEIQLFEKENSLLFNELNSLTEEVNQIQGRVVKIAELQQVLTEKVLDQEKDIERIATTTVSATENIREGNEQLRQALQSNSGFRIAIIFFILVLFFSILFLDWYND